VGKFGPFGNELEREFVQKEEILGHALVWELRG